MAWNAAEFLQQDALSQTSGSAVGVILLLPQGTFNRIETRFGCHNRETGWGEFYWPLVGRGQGCC